MADTLSVAVLGTGIMGAGMARNLAAAGHEVRAWNRTLSRAEPLAAEGVHITGDPAEAVRGADAVITMLLDGPSVLRTMRDASPGLREGVVWAQTSTVGPDGLAPLAALARERGVHFVDAPVLGTRQAAEGGQLTVLAAGPGAARPVADRVFDAIGRKVLWLGEDGAEGTGSSLKLVLNSWVLAVTNGAAEAMALAKGLGVDPRHFFEALGGGPLDLPYLRMKSEAILSGDFAPNFTVDGALKDARLIVAAGQAHGVRLDVAAACAERFSRAAGQGHGGEDMAASYFASFDT
ncbi:NAD(P)-dependent oxidoreductase [Streptomyces sp. H10-C2]|uniref:NAD(P)-dependent oxidoreductase n=1 Tax=unclassified Streptomyces TaxID=2593676 RepID=UPI0024B9FEF1|nr:MULTISPECIES: NAD(P)-dependent oxidoreductase [unclassified Streptomyces]MDJ0343710.1 NAD(P)-dependent oxidoreductase [Streptomyces sp. PH10-H1]MDJ0372363.1 NAD(P)-dependent oxidoreductase [Streptomyces sp. H10-C2]